MYEIWYRFRSIKAIDTIVEGLKNFDTETDNQQKFQYQYHNEVSSGTETHRGMNTG